MGSVPPCGSFSLPAQSIVAMVTQAALFIEVERKVSPYSTTIGLHMYVVSLCFCI